MNFGYGCGMAADNPTELTVTQPDVLDHAQEFVEIVYRKAPGQYRELLGTAHFQRLLEQRTFDHGKLFAWAEFLVFREEFQGRFPGLPASDCIGAFCKLLLKNDISMTNLLKAIEGSPSQEARMLQRKHPPDQS